MALRGRYWTARRIRACCRLARSPPGDTPGPFGTSGFSDLNRGRGVQPRPAEHLDTHTRMDDHGTLVKRNDEHELEQWLAWFDTLGRCIRLASR